MSEKLKKRPLWFLPLSPDIETCRQMLLTAHRVLLYAGYKCKKINGIYLTYRRGTRRKIELPFRNGIPAEVKQHLDKVKPKGYKQ